MPLTRASACRQLFRNEGATDEQVTEPEPALESSTRRTRSVAARATPQARERVGTAEPKLHMPRLRKGRELCLKHGGTRKDRCASCRDDVISKYGRASMNRTAIARLPKGYCKHFKRRYVCFNCDAFDPDIWLQRRMQRLQDCQGSFGPGRIPSTPRYGVAAER